jgi:tagaturonate epimerase
MRELARTGRSPQNVLDDATWDVFAEGRREGFGPDAGADIPIAADCTLGLRALLGE